MGSGAAGHQDDRAERLAGIAARAFILAVRGPEGLDGHLTAAAQRQLDLRPLGEAMLAFASELMRKEFLHTPALMAVAQRLIEGVDLPDIATIAAGVHGVVAASPRTRTAEGRRDLALALAGLAKQLAEARFRRTHGLLDLARLLLYEEGPIL
ncbi:MAG TPA: hypothetical protein VE714_06245 [Gemmatimonadales bacterium]|nr:hypothetical protein [Gemmatimonadales bacterium]